MCRNGSRIFVFSDGWAFILPSSGKTRELTQVWLMTSSRLSEEHWRSPAGRRDWTRKIRPQYMRTWDSGVLLCSTGNSSGSFPVHTSSWFLWAPPPPLPTYIRGTNMEKVSSCKYLAFTYWMINWTGLIPQLIRRPIKNQKRNELLVSLLAQLS